jgi:hypothetical protein
MSNKKISELELVASNASGDQFPLVQNGETMKTTMSKIVAFLDTIFTTTSDVASQITTALVGYATEEYTDNAADEASAKAITDANEYTDQQIATRQLEYDLNNTATGTTTVTINATSGVATFTQTLSAKSNIYFDINNTQIQTNSLLECNLFYNGAGFPIIMHYRTETNKIRFHIGNIAVDGGSGTATNANLVITFRKI